MKLSWLARRCSRSRCSRLPQPAAQAAPRYDAAERRRRACASCRVTEDSVTLRWNASTDNSGSIHRYVVNPASTTPATARRRRSPAWCRTTRMTYRVSAPSTPPATSSAPSAPLTATTARGRDRADRRRGPAADRDVSPSSISLAWDRSTDRWSFSYEILDGRRVIASASSTSTRLRKLAPGRDAHVQRCARATPAGTSRGSSNALDRDAAGERRHDGAERAVEPDRRGPRTTSAAA